jgi:hypothetical protein
MSSGKRILLFGGIALALLGMSYGLWYAVFAEHQALDGIGASLASGFSAAANRDQARSSQALEQYREAKYRYDRQVDAHSHWIGLAMVLIVLGIGFDGINFSRRQKVVLAWMLLVGSVLFPLGVLLQTLSHASASRDLAVAGSALVIVSMGAAIIGFLRRPVTGQALPR